MLWSPAEAVALAFPGPSAEADGTGPKDFSGLRAIKKPITRLVKAISAVMHLPLHLFLHYQQLSRHLIWGLGLRALGFRNS